MTDQNANLKLSDFGASKIVDGVPKVFTKILTDAESINRARQKKKKGLMSVGKQASTKISIGKAKEKTKLVMSVRSLAKAEIKKSQGTKRKASAVSSAPANKKAANVKVRKFSPKKELADKLSGIYRELLAHKKEKKNQPGPFFTHFGMIYIPEGCWEEVGFVWWWWCVNRA